MVDAHEVTLSESDFAMLNNGNYLILNLENIEVRDYILFHKQDDANSFCMTRIDQITTHEGFKDGYALYTFSRLA